MNTFSSTGDDRTAYRDDDRHFREAYDALLAENERLRERLANLALEATHFLDNGIGRIHLRESIERANFALAGGRGEK